MSSLDPVVEITTMFMIAYKNSFEKWITLKGDILPKDIKAIPTEYEGVLFRSKLEVSWAKFFNSINMKWVYEVEAYQFPDGTRYLPDFWFPDCRTFFEVKGVLNDKDQTKLHNLAKAVYSEGIMVAIGMTGIPESLGLVKPIPYKWADCWAGDGETGILVDKNYVDIAICAKCNKPYIIYKAQGWSCRNCSYYDGDNTWSSLILYG